MISPLSITTLHIHIPYLNHKTHNPHKPPLCMEFPITKFARRPDLRLGRNQHLHYKYLLARLLRKPAIFTTYVIPFRPSRSQQRLTNMYWLMLSHDHHYRPCSPFHKYNKSHGIQHQAVALGKYCIHVSSTLFQFCTINELFVLLSTLVFLSLHLFSDPFLRLFPRLRDRSRTDEPIRHDPTWYACIYFDD